MSNRSIITTSVFAAGTAVARPSIAPMDSETTVDLYTLRTPYSPATGTYSLRWDLSATSESRGEDIDMREADLVRILQEHRNSLRDDLSQDIKDLTSNVNKLFTVSAVHEQRLQGLEDRAEEDRQTIKQTADSLDNIDTRLTTIESKAGTIVSLLKYGIPSLAALYTIFQIVYLVR